MKRIILALSLTLCALAVPATASAHPMTGRHFGVYRYVYRHAVKKLGQRQVGCELVYTCAGRASDEIVVGSTHTLERMLHPRPTFHATAGVPAPSLPYGQWAIPASIVQCESTFQNLPPNSADASGYYQILGSTWAANGGAPPDEAYEHSKGEQDAVAARIWDGGAGASQWVCKA